MNSVSFSVVVCTHNRSRYLSDVIASLRQQEYAPYAYEIIVVDNASTDETRQEVKRLQQLDGHSIHCVHESRLGLSHARNKGAEVAQGQWIAYLDDDSIAEPDWLQGFSSILKADQECVWALAGRIELGWMAERPPWLAGEVDWIFSHTEAYGSEPRFLTPPEGPLGGNMVVRKAALARVGGFDSGMGRQGTRLLSNDELDLAFRIWEMGGQILYVPSAVVHHLVYPERLRRDVILRRVFWQGASDVLVQQKQTPLTRRELVIHALGGVYQSALDAGRWVRALRQRDDQEVFTQLFNLCGRLGRTRQFIELAIRSRP